MALQKRSRLHKVLLNFDEEGTYVTGEALFQEGAWDTDAKDWEGTPVAREYPLSNVTPEAKKFLNDVIGVAAAKALETASVAAEALEKAKAFNTDAVVKLTKMADELKDALGARDNFAALHKEAKAEAMQRELVRAGVTQLLLETDVKLGKIPRLIRKMFGAI